MAFLGFTLKLASSIKKKKSYDSKVSNLIHATVVEINDSLKAEIDLDPNGEKQQILNFTEDSYDLVNRENVFTKEKDEHGKRIRFIRDASHAKFHPGSSERYYPFDKGCIIKGWIVKVGDLKLFKFKDLVSYKGYNNFNTELFE